MLSLSQYLAYEWGVLAVYTSGFAILAPPLGLGGGAVGWWATRRNPLASRLASALLAASVGAFLALGWQATTLRLPTLDWLTRLAEVWRDLLAPATGFWATGRPDALLLIALFYSPVPLAFLLYLLANRYEEELSGWVGGLREGVRERRAARRAARAEAESRRIVIRLDDEPSPVPLPEVASVPIDAPAPAVPAVPAVVDARAGEAVALIVNVPPPPLPAATLPRARRGGVAGFFVGLYYAVATLQKAWLPLALLALWLFWTPLVGYAEHEMIATGSAILGHFKPW